MGLDKIPFPNVQNQRFRNAFFNIEPRKGCNLFEVIPRKKVLKTSNTPSFLSLTSHFMKINFPQVFSIKKCSHKIIYPLTCQYNIIYLSHFQHPYPSQIPSKNPKNTKNTLKTPINHPLTH